MSAPVPPNNLLVSGRVLLFLPSLVAAIGLNEALVLQQVRYYLADERQPRLWQDTRWVRASIERWQERDFPFWGLKTVQRALESLVKQGFLRAAQPELARRDATKWYTIDFVALAPLARLVEQHRRERRATLNAVEGHEHASAPPLPASHLLLDEPPLVVAVDLARRVGLDEALLLQQIRYWLADERHPLVREGRRWVCPRDVDFFAPLVHRSPETLGRTLSGLERSGLLHSTSRHNQQPGDRTKWYTIDFIALDRLVAAQPASHAAAEGHRHQTDDMTTSKPTKRPDTDGATDHIQAERSTESNCGIGPTPGVVNDQHHPVSMIRSLKDSETTSETDPPILQQENEESHHVVASIVQQLIVRGVTEAAAQRLVAASPLAIIAKQLDIYDWLREHEPTNGHLSPGRLRRMIEEDWNTPSGYRTPSERRSIAEAHERDQGSRITLAQTRQAEVTRRLAERDGLMAEFGLTADDQRRWVGVVAAVPGLPEVLRGAFFRAPARRTAEPAVVIVADRAAFERAHGAAMSAARAAIAAHLTRLCQRPNLEVVYFDVPTLREHMRAPVEDDNGDVSGDSGIAPPPVDTR